MNTELETTTRLRNALAAKYLTFALGKESYGITVRKVREIIQMLTITSIPQMPECVKGVINLRGKVIPVIDLRVKFGMAKSETTGDTCIVVVKVALSSGAEAQMGLVVDAVEEVVNITPNEIEETPDFGTRETANYILGMAKIKDKVKTLLDIDGVVTGPMAAQIARVAGGS